MSEPMGCVYFLQGVDGGPIKIGFTARTTQRRLTEVQPAYPEPLRIVLALPGTRRDETEHHRVFGFCRMCGEWFQPDAELLWYIEAARRNPAAYSMPLSWVAFKHEEARDASLPRMLPRKGYEALWGLTPDNPYPGLSEQPAAEVA